MDECNDVCKEIKKEEKIRVFVRIRPLSFEESQQNTSRCITRLDDVSLKYLASEDRYKSDMVFNFDHIFLEETQQQLYKRIGNSMVENAWKGVNSSLFAYGQTGSGKTHTMMGSDDIEGEGLIPRICKSLFDSIGSFMSSTTRKDSMLEKKSNEIPIDNLISDVSLSVSYYEVYNERVKDLLAESVSVVGENTFAVPFLRIREHPTRGPFVDGALSLKVSNWLELLPLLKKGNSRRTVAETRMNAASSRSHAILQFSFQQKFKVIEDENNLVASMQGTCRESTLTMIDLAGSERAKKSGATGNRLVEASNINKSLLALGNVINALTEVESSNAEQSAHIPYRNSILTWLLRESLGGNAQTIMIATISPSSVQQDETFSTLRYADRAKHIKTHAIVNEDPNLSIIRALRAEIKFLKAALDAELTRNHEEIAATREENILIPFETESIVEKCENTICLSSKSHHEVSTIVTDILEDDCAVTLLPDILVCFEIRPSGKRITKSVKDVREVAGKDELKSCHDLTSSLTKDSYLGPTDVLDATLVTNSFKKLKNIEEENFEGLMDKTCLVVEDIRKCSQLALEHAITANSSFTQKDSMVSAVKSIIPDIIMANSISNFLYYSPVFMMTHGCCSEYSQQEYANLNYGLSRLTVSVQSGNGVKKHSSRKINNLSEAGLMSGCCTPAYSTAALVCDAGIKVDNLNGDFHVIRTQDFTHHLNMLESSRKLDENMSELPDILIGYGAVSLLPILNTPQIGGRVKLWSIYQLDGIVGDLCWEVSSSCRINKINCDFVISVVIHTVRLRANKLKSDELYLKCSVFEEKLVSQDSTLFPNDYLSKIEQNMEVSSSDRLHCHRKDFSFSGISTELLIHLQTSGLVFELYKKSGPKLFEKSTIPVSCISITNDRKCENQVDTEFIPSTNTGEISASKSGLSSIGSTQILKDMLQSFSLTCHSNLSQSHDAKDDISYGKDLHLYITADLLEGQKNDFQDYAAHAHLLYNKLQTSSNLITSFQPSALKIERFFYASENFNRNTKEFAAYKNTPLPLCEILDNRRCMFYLSSESNKDRLVVIRVQQILPISSDRNAEKLTIQNVSSCEMGTWRIAAKDNFTFYSELGTEVMLPLSSRESALKNYPILSVCKHDEENALYVAVYLPRSPLLETPCGRGERIFLPFLLNIHARGHLNPIPLKMELCCKVINSPIKYLTNHYPGHAHRQYPSHERLAALSTCGTHYFVKRFISTGIIEKIESDIVDVLSNIAQVQKKVGSSLSASDSHILRNQSRSYKNKESHKFDITNTYDIFEKRDRNCNGMQVIKVLASNSANNNPECAGFLFFKDANNVLSLKWTQRYFVLKRPLLYMCSTNSKPKTSDILCLGSGHPVKMQICSNTFEITLIAAESSWKLHASDESDLNRWVFWLSSDL